MNPGVGGGRRLKLRRRVADAVGMNATLPAMMTRIVDGQIVDRSTVAVRREPHPPVHAAIAPRVPVTVRAGTLDDLPFIDRLQKAHGRALGFLATMALEGKVRGGHVLVAEGARGEGQGASKDNTANASAPSLAPCPLPLVPLAYLIAADRYLKRDELGYVTQLCVAPEARGSLVAAALLQAQFDRSASGCKLYCCWCAQDLTVANAFWEAMGFTAIAFRTGSMRRGADSRQLTADSEGKGASSPLAVGCKLSASRVHIFWQKRILAGDDSTPWWYPCQTGGGALRADRLVFPIPAGVHWRDVGPIVIPAAHGEEEHESTRMDTSPHEAPEQTVSLREDSRRFLPFVAPTLDRRQQSKNRAKPAESPPSPPSPPPPVRRGLWFGEAITEQTIYEGGGRTYAQPLARAIPATPLPAVPVPITNEEPDCGAGVPPARAGRRLATAGRRPAPQAKIDPRLVALSRELRDQWSERQAAVASPTIAKHDVRRVARAASVGIADAMKLAA